MKITPERRKALFHIVLDETEAEAVACAAIRGIDAPALLASSDLGESAPQALARKTVARFHAAMFDAFSTADISLRDSSEVIGEVKK